MRRCPRCLRMTSGKKLTATRFFAGQSDIKKLRRENEMLKKEIWCLRDGYDKLERLIKEKGIDSSSSSTSCSSSDSVSTFVLTGKILANYKCDFIFLPLIISYIYLNNSSTKLYLIQQFHLYLIS